MVKKNTREKMRTDHMFVWLILHLKFLFNQVVKLKSIT